jgi:hypothetical protein
MLLVIVMKQRKFPQSQTLVVRARNHSNQSVKTGNLGTNGSHRNPCNFGSQGNHGNQNISGNIIDHGNRGTKANTVIIRNGNKGYHVSVTNQSTKVGSVPRQVEDAQGVSGRLRLRNFLTFGTMKAVRSSQLSTGRLYPQEYPGTHF